MSNADYSCPICGELPNPNQFGIRNHSDDKKIAYLLDEYNRLILPIAEHWLRPINHCGEWFYVPFHQTPESYFEAIRPQLGFFAPTTGWVKDYLECGIITVGNRVYQRDGSYSEVKLTK